MVANQGLPGFPGVFFCDFQPLTMVKIQLYIHQLVQGEGVTGEP